MPETEIGAALAAPEGNAVASIPAQVEIIETPKKTIEETMAETFDKFNQPRDDQTQRFAAKDKSETQAVETETAPATETKEQAPSKDISEPAKPAIIYPNSLPAELREKLDAAAPELKDWISKREAESHKRITELGTAAKAIEPFRQITERYKASFKGMDAPAAYEKLAAANEFLERDPVAGLQWLANAYNVDLPKLGNGTQPQGTEASPEIASLRQTISQLQRQIAETSNRVSSREQQEQTQHQQSIEKLVEDFAKDKPYWSELEGEILSQIHAIRATDPNLPDEKKLERAYDHAMKLNGSVQAKIDADSKAEADKKAKAEAAKKADAAKKAASINVRSGQGASPKSKGNWEDTMREVADRLMG